MFPLFLEGWLGGALESGSGKVLEVCRPGVRLKQGSGGCWHRPGCGDAGGREGSVRVAQGGPAPGRVAGRVPCAPMRAGVAVGDIT